MNALESKTRTMENKIEVFQRMICEGLVERCVPENLELPVNKRQNLENLELLENEKSVTLREVQCTE